MWRGVRPAHRRRGTVIAAATLLLVAPSCDSTGPESPRAYDLRVASPNGAEGAAVLELRGPVARVTAPAGLVLAHGDGDVTRVVLVLDTPGELRLAVNPATRGATVEATLVEVSGPDDRPRASVDGYTVSLEGRR